MQKNNHVLNITKLALSIGSTAAALLIMPMTNALASDLINVQVGGVTCGTVSSAKVLSNTLVLESFVGQCGLSGGGTGGTGGTGTDGDGTDGGGTGGTGGTGTDGDGTDGDGTDGDGTGGDTNTGEDSAVNALAGGRQGSGWEGSNFPHGPLVFESINKKDADGRVNKYIYYKIDAQQFNGRDYIGDISVFTNTNSAGSVFSSWVSATPGGEEVGRRCSSVPRAESVMQWSTSYNNAPSYTCKINSPGTYYLNISDRSQADLASGKKGLCTSTRGCEFGLKVSSALK